jgi:hypothetical protein
MWYFLSIIVSCLGMYLILAHKDRELRGNEPHHVVHKVRESTNRMLSGVWRRARAVGAHLVMAIARYIVIGCRMIARGCVWFGREVAVLASHFWHIAKRAIHAVADKVAHPHAKHVIVREHKRHLSSAVEQPFCKR